MSVDYLNDKQWKAKRKTVITATESASILGLNPWKTAAKMWHDKTSGNIFVPNSYIKVGLLLEEVVVKATNEVMNMNFELYENGDKKAFYVNENLRLGATPDAHDKKENVLLECKTTKPFNIYKWAYTPPPYYIFQLQTQMICTGHEKGYLAIMGTDLSQKSEELDLPLIIFEVHRCNKLEALLKERLDVFWQTVKENKRIITPKIVKDKANLLNSLTYRKVL